MKKIGNNRYRFEALTYPPPARWGEYPELDQTGSTLHLSPRTEVIEKEPYDWLHFQCIRYKVVERERTYIIIEILEEKDRILFDLTYA